MDNSRYGQDRPEGPYGHDGSGDGAGPRGPEGQGSEGGHALPVCPRHPDRETGVRCVRCDRPVCPECMISASVGFQCPDCVRKGGSHGGAAQPRTLAGGGIAGDTRLVTKILIGINLAVFVAIHLGTGVLDEVMLRGGPGFYAGGYRPAEGVVAGEWYRLLTSAFAHEAPWHLAFNMLGLWWLGAPLEAALGRARYLALYLLSALGGSALTYVLVAPGQASLGASGAVFGLLGATAVLMRRLRYDMRPVLVLLALNLLFTFTWPDIAWQAHLGGLIAGGLLSYAMIHAPRDRRALMHWGSCVLLFVVIVAAVTVRTMAVLRQGG